MLFLHIPFRSNHFNNKTNMVNMSFSESEGKRVKKNILKSDNHNKTDNHNKFNLIPK